jgi:hypothetical protein
VLKTPNRNCDEAASHEAPKRARKWNEPKRSSRIPKHLPTPEELDAARRLVLEVEREMKAAKQLLARKHKRK